LQIIRRHLHKNYGGQKVKAGMIIVRQRGSKIRAGKNVKKGEDDTLYASLAGTVKFSQKSVKRFTGKIKSQKFANVVPGK